MGTGFMRLPRIGRSLCNGEPQTQTDRANELNNVARQDLAQPESFDRRSSLTSVASDSSRSVTLQTVSCMKLDKVNTRGGRTFEVSF